LSAARRSDGEVVAGLAWLACGVFGLLWQQDPVLWAFAGRASPYAILGGLFGAAGLITAVATVATGGRAATFGSAAVTTCGGAALVTAPLDPRDQVLLLSAVLFVDAGLRSLQRFPLRLSGLFAFFVVGSLLIAYPLSTIFGAFFGAADATLRGLCFLGSAARLLGQGETVRAGASHSTRVSPR